MALIHVSHVPVQAVQGIQTPHSLPVGQIFSERPGQGATVSSRTREARASDQAIGGPIGRYSPVSSDPGGSVSSRTGEAKVPDQGVLPQANVERRQVGNDTVAWEEMKTSPGESQEVRFASVREAPERGNTELIGSGGEEEIEGGGGSPEGRGEGESSQDSGLLCARYKKHFSERAPNFCSQFFAGWWC